MSPFLNILGCFFLLCGGLFAKETLTVGSASGYAPYVSLDARGEYEGFDVDLAKLVAEKLKKRLVVKDLGSMPSLLIGLKQGKVDVVIWGVSITEERLKQMDMVYYQGEKVTTLPLLFWGKIPENNKSLEDLGGGRAICVEAGSYQEQVLRSYPGLNLKNVDKITDAILEIKFGKSLACAIDNSLVPFAREQSPELKVLYFQLPPQLQALGNGICINKSNPELMAQVKQAVEELTNEGKVRELEKKWNIGS